MKLKNVFLSVGIFAFALGMFGLGSSKAEANACTMTSGTWDGAVGTATNAGGTAVFSGCTGGTTYTPALADTLTINDGITLTISGNAQVAGITIANPATGNNGIVINDTKILTDTGGLTYTANAATGFDQSITINGTGRLLVTGAFTMNAPASATGNSYLTCAGAGILTISGALNISGNAGNFAGRAIVSGGACAVTVTGLTTITGTANATGIGELNIGAGGTLNLNGGLTFAAGGGITNAKLSTPAASTINFVGTMTGAGTLNLFAGTLFKTTGTTTIPVFNSFKNFEVVSGTTTFSGAVAVTGLQVDSGATLASGANLITDTGTGTGVNGFTINGIWTGTGGATLSGIGATIDGTAGTNYGNTGTLTLTGAKTIASTAVLTIPATIALSADTAVTNNGAITTTGAAGITGANATTSTWTQGTNSTLNFGGDTTSLLLTGVLVATASGNTVNYNKAGDQTVKVAAVSPAVSYYNLTLSGGSVAVKTFTSAIHVTNNISIATATSTNLTGASTTGYLKFNNVEQHRGPWGFTTAAVQHTNTVFMTVGSGSITASRDNVPVSNGSTQVLTITAPTTTTTETTTTTTETTTTVVDTTPGCSGGNVFNTSTGKPCSNNTEVTSKKVYALGQVTLKNGSKGEAVKELQRFLNDKLSLGLKIDGKLGPKTIAVIKKWQKANGLVSDGLVGAKTKAMMNK